MASTTPGPTTTQATPADSRPSPSSLAFILGDRIAPPDKALSVGYELPCGAAKVQLKPLARLLVAIAVWQLRERGAVALERFERKRLFIKQQKIGLRRTGEGFGVPGLEDALLAQVTSDLQKSSVEDVVFRLLGQDSHMPEGVILDTIVGFLAQQGYYRDVDAGRGAISGAILGRQKRQPDCERMAGLRGSGEQVIAGWSAFQQSEPELAAELVKAAENGISSRQEQRDSD
ncbi:MAG TPA: hypothetical protein VFK38_04750 [Candidatus Limnocylindrales bacterium]|nr:hypothetical protein [Candidatus Limnocylindrales bacterium]